MLELHDVVKHYSDPSGASIRAIDGVSFTLEAGELVAVYGPSGSGKSTLLSLMAGLLRPDRGSVVFERRDISGLSRRDAARYRLRDVGLIAQSAWMVPGLTAADNASLKLIADLPNDRAKDHVAPLLERVGLSSRAGHPAAKLSVGERQRVAIVRALSNGPRVILADEPTGNLDTRRSEEILSLLSELCHERSVGALVATHDPQAAVAADRVYVLRDGCLHAREFGERPTDPVVGTEAVTVPGPKHET